MIPDSPVSLFFNLCLLLAGIPNAFYFGQEGLHNILCIDLLGPSLEDLFDMCGRKFTIKTVVMVAKQMVLFFFVAEIILCDLVPKERLCPMNLEQVT